MTPRPREKWATGIPGLDVILHGGIEAQTVYVIQGTPGAGKTVLANHIAHQHVARGGVVLYVTLLAETHERMLFNLEQFAFFEATAVPERFAYLSGFTALEEGGLKALTDLLRHEARSRKATLLVVDGLAEAEETAESARAFKKFIHDLQVHASFLGCMVLLIRTGAADDVSPTRTMVDGVIEVTHHRVGRRAEREIEVKKLRGSGYVRGSHPFQITGDGITVFPRFEAQYRDATASSPGPHRMSTGIVSLDAALHGGVMSTSATVVVGPTGSGKTILGLHFLDASTEAEPGLHFGFYETPPEILRKAAGLGLGLGAKHDAGLLHFLWQPPTELVLDALGHRLLTTVRERGVKRLFVDGLDSFIKATNDGDRISPFFSALTNQLRIAGVTAMYTLELHRLISRDVVIPVQGISALTENILLLRLVEQDGALLRLLSVAKTRDSGNDPTLRALDISSSGMKLGDPLRSNVGNASGNTRRLLGRILKGRQPSS